MSTKFDGRDKYKLCPCWGTKLHVCPLAPHDAGRRAAQTVCVCVPLSPGVYVVVKKGERLQKENNKGKLYLSVSGGSGFSVWDVSVVVVEHSAPLVSSGFL